jgi:GTP-binding protein
MLSDTPGSTWRFVASLAVETGERETFPSRSSVIIFLLENPSPASFDIELAGIVRRLGLPVIVAVNKMDGPRDFQNLGNFYEMGFDDILPISALNRLNIGLCWTR